MPPPDDPVFLPDERPSTLRYWVIVSAVLMSILLYLDRFCVSFAETYIQEDLGLSTEQMGMFLSAFFWSYALGQVPAGWMSDRYGPRLMMVAYIISWSFFTAYIGMAMSFAALMLARLGCGIGQAGAYPTSGSLLSVWVPLSQRGTASSIVAFGGRFGGAIAPILTAQLMLLLVPVSYSSQLRERDLLPKHERELCAKLVAGVPATDGSPPVATPAGRIWERLSDIDREALRAGAAQDSPDVDQRRSIVMALNRAVTASDLYDKTAFRDLPLAREAWMLIGRIDEGQSLTQPQTERLNRLLLEAAFKSELGKLYVAGWRPVMFIYGGAGVIVASLFWLVFRNHPNQHPGCNAAERALIAAGRENQPVAQPTALPIGPMVCSMNLWHCSLCQIGTNIGWLFIVTFLSRYLLEVHQVEIVQRSWMASIPMMAGMLGMLLGGPFTDLLSPRIGRRWGRALPIAITRLGAALAFVGCLWVKDPWLATALFALVAFFCDLGIASIWAFVQDVGGKHVGSVLGWGNMWGNFAAAIAPLLYGYLLLPANASYLTQTFGSNWNAMFLMCAAAFVWSSVHALGINASRPLVPE